MLRLPRSLATLVTLLFASATMGATAAAATPDSTDSTDKPTVPAKATKATKAKSTTNKDKKHVEKRRVAALLKSEKKGDKNAKKLPQLPAPSAKAEPKKGEPKAAEEKLKAKRAEEKAEKKTAPIDEPPAELTGALPQAKLADKKAKKSEEKLDKKSLEKADKSEKKLDKKAEEKADKSEKNLEEKKAKPTKEEGEKARPEVSFGRAPKGKSGSLAAKTRMKTCFNPTVSLTRLGQAADVAFPLTACDGKPTLVAIENLSVLARPYDVPAPRLMPASTLAKGPKGQRAFSAIKGELAPGVRRIDSGLVMRVQAIANRFPGKTITLVSGYRPASKGSEHAKARALDLRVDGVTNETLVAFCKTLKDTGCGYYPNSFFVHVDVRPERAGHVYWIDVSGPGEKPEYVKSWPPPLPDAPTLAAKDEPSADVAAEAKDDKEAAATSEEKTIDVLADPWGSAH